MSNQRKSLIGKDKIFEASCRTSLSSFVLMLNHFKAFSSTISHSSLCSRKFFLKNATARAVAHMSISWIVTEKKELSICGRTTKLDGKSSKIFFFTFWFSLINWHFTTGAFFEILLKNICVISTFHVRQRETLSLTVPLCFLRFLRNCQSIARIHQMPVFQSAAL